MSSNKHIAWLLNESRLWVSEGVIDAAQAERIRARYPAASGMTWGLFILTAIGAIVFGLGVILFFAYNWSDLPKFAKLGLIFGALVLSHLIALFLAYKNPDNRNLVEGFHLLGTMMFGAGIWLIAQIYHIDEHYPTAFALWGAGALVLAWASPSVLQGLIASILITVWGSTEITDFGNLHLISIALLVFGVMSLGYYQKSRALLFFGLTGSMFITVANVFMNFDDEAIYFLTFAFSVLLIAFARLTRASSFPEAGDVFRTVGIIIYGLLLLLTTFETVTTEIAENIPSGTGHIVAIIALVITAVSWGLLMASFISSGVKKIKIAELLLVFIAIIFMLLLVVGVFNNNAAIGVLLINAVLAAHCVVLIIVGTDELNWRHVTVGCFTLGFLIYWRFNDLFHSLLMRSMVFLIVGAMLFFIGHIYSRQAAQRQTNA